MMCPLRGPALMMTLSSAMGFVASVLYVARTAPRMRDPARHQRTTSGNRSTAVTLTQPRGCSAAAPTCCADPRRAGFGGWPGVPGSVTASDVARPCGRAGTAEPRDTRDRERTDEQGHPERDCGDAAPGGSIASAPGRSRQPRRCGRTAVRHPEAAPRASRRFGLPPAVREHDRQPPAGRDE